SYFYSRPATEVVAERLWPTIQLGVMSYAVALLGVPLGVIAGLNRGRLADVLVRLLATIGHALPTWWLGLTSVGLLSSLTGWLPNGQGHGSIGEGLKYISLPAIGLGLAGLGTLPRFVRAVRLDARAGDCGA